MRLDLRFPKRSPRRRLLQYVEIALKGDLSGRVESLGGTLDR